MPWSKPKFKPGLNSRDQGLANEAGMADSNFVRIRDGLPETLGGWAARSIVDDRYDNQVRASHAWRTLDGSPMLAYATSSNLYAEYDGEQRDIPLHIHNTVLSSVFLTTSGSNVVRVLLAFHGLITGQFVTFSNMQLASYNGLTPTHINGTFAVTVVTPDEFTFVAGANASSTSSVVGGGYVDFLATLEGGLVSSTSTTELRDWTLASWGEFLLANPSGGGIYEYQPAETYPDLVFNGSFTGNANGWALGTGWSYNSNAAKKSSGVASNLSQNVEGFMDGGRFYEVTFSVTSFDPDGALRFRINSGDPAAVIDVGAASSPISRDGTYTRIFLCPYDPIDIVFEADIEFEGTVDNVSITIVSSAYRIVTAPPRVDAMFVDIKGLVVALGTTLSDGRYSSSAYRCSDLTNNRSWVPDVASYASEGTLQGAGGRLMAGLSTRQQSLVWGDEGVVSFKWLGEFGEAFDINLLGGGCGLISRHAMLEHNGFVLWMTNNGQFRYFQGVGISNLGEPQILRCPIQEEVFANRVVLQDLKINAGVNAKFSEAWFSVPDTRDGTDECSRVYAVAWTEGDETGSVPWVVHRMARTSWQEEGIFPTPIAFAPAETDKGRIFDHEVGYTDDGEPLNEYLLTSAFDIAEGENIMLFNQIIPHFSNQTGTVQIDIYGRMSPNGSEFQLSTPLESAPTTENLYFRFKARQIAMRFLGVTLGGFWRWGAVRFDVSQTAAKK